MILGIGTDIVYNKRLEKLIPSFEGKFLERVFTQNEIIKSNQLIDLVRKTSFFAKRFAAKEAFAKALGLGIGRGINFSDIEIYNDQFGKPEIKLLNGKEKFVSDHFGCNEFSIKLSLSDETYESNPLAIAFVIIETK